MICIKSVVFCGNGTARGNVDIGWNTPAIILLFVGDVTAVAVILNIISNTPSKFNGAAWRRCCDCIELDLP